jgi:peptidoglycan/xylan/chitin deacetylase (PgdA/CDA1 family)
MFFDHDINGSDLPPKTLCLTYDDGPGRHTEEIGRFLFEHEIEATFFVMGRHAVEQPQTLRRLHAWGHLIGNHTYHHPGLVDLVKRGGDVAAELIQTDAVIREFLTDGLAFFRPPYGSWREPACDPLANRAAKSPVAAILNQIELCRHYVGPIKWDIVGEDWKFWEEDGALDACVQAHLEAIERKHSGIVLLHDSSEDPAVAARNKTYGLTRAIVPILKDEGYRFIRLDQVPQMRFALEARLS